MRTHDKSKSEKGPRSFGAYGDYSEVSSNAGRGPTLGGP